MDLSGALAAGALHVVELEVSSLVEPKSVHGPRSTSVLLPSFYYAFPEHFLVSSSYIWLLGLLLFVAFAYRFSVPRTSSSLYSSF